MIEAALRIFLLYLGIICTYCLLLTVHNKNVLENSLVDHNLIIELSFDEGFAPLDSIRNGSLCFSSNGITCHCFPESYGNVVPFLPVACVPTSPWHHYWFGASLTLNGAKSNGAYFHGSGEKRLTITSLPVYVVNRLANDSETYLSLAHKYSEQLTLVLPLTIDDLSRASVLMRSLQVIPQDQVFELLVFVPEWQLESLSQPVLAMTSRCNFTTKVYSEGVLFARDHSDINAYSYAIQMAVKLLAARMVSTRFYVTLDADILLLHPLTVRSLLEHGVESDIAGTQPSPNDGTITATATTTAASVASAVPLASEGRRAVYHWEGREVHEHWWAGSERLLGLRPPKHSSDQTHSGQPHSPSKLKQGFGVTPAVLSTFGSLLTVAHTCQTLLFTRHDLSGSWGAQSDVDDAFAQQLERMQTQPGFRSNRIHPHDQARCEQAWIDGFGKTREQQRQRRPKSLATEQDGGTSNDSDGDIEGNELQIWSEYTLYRIVLDLYQVQLLLP